MSRRRIRLLTLVPLESRDVPSVPTTWSHRGVGGGGALFSPSYSTTNPQEIYIASDMSQLFRSADGGTSWQTVPWQELEGNRGAKVQFTSDPQVRYCIDFSTVSALDLARPSKSTDDGATWTPLAADPTGGDAWYLFADPNNTTTVLLSDYTRLFVSTNGGTSFTQRYVTADTSAGLHVGGAFFDGPNIYVGTNKGLLVSTNGGTSFSVSSVTGIPATEALVSFTGAKQGGTVRLFGVTLGSGDVYAGITGADFFGYQSVYTLDVGQPAWVPHVSGIPAGNYPYFVGTSRTDINTAYVGGGSDAGAPVVFKTTNGGGNWQNVLLTTNNQNVQTGWSGHGGDRGWSYGEYVLGLAVAPTDPSRVVITDLGFAHQTTDGGTSWRAVYVNPADLNPATLPTPQGQDYRSSGLDNTTSWSIAWADASHMVAGNSDIRGQVSADAGQSWSFDYTGHTLNSMYRVIRHPTTGTLYAATSSVHDMYQSTYLRDSNIDSGDGEVRFSTNLGATWQLAHDFNHPVVWVAHDPNNSNRLYASVIHNAQGGIYVTNNLSAGGGSTWIKLTNPPRTEGHPFNIVVLNDGTLVATYSGRRTAAGAFTASSGVFVSTNGGTSWLDRSHSGMFYWTKDITIDPADPGQNTWYTGVWSGWGGPPNGLGGLYKTTNRGVNWTKINSLDRVTGLYINPTNTEEAYLTTEVDGLWVTSNLHGATPTFTAVGSYPFRHPEWVFFNPFNPGEVWITSFGNGLRVGTANAPPTVSSVVVNNGTAQRSMVTSATVTFSELVTFAGPAANAFNLNGPSGNVAVTVDTSQSTPTQTVAKLTFSGPNTTAGSLNDGNYMLTVLASQVSDGAFALDGNGDGTPGDNASSTLFRLFGDADGDWDVDSLDFLAFRATSGLSSGNPGFNAAFDSDNDGDVDSTDFLGFRTRFGTGI